MKDDFFDNVSAIIEQARRFVGQTADLTMCMTYFEIGRMIVEQEQGGKSRAEYGRSLLPELSAHLTERFGKGFSAVNLKNFRKFYLTYQSSIGQTVSAKFEKDQVHDSDFAPIPIWQTVSAKLPPFKLSWSHYQILMRIKNEQERRFYEIEADLAGKLEYLRF